jgi:hypothetical protein
MIFLASKSPSFQKNLNLTRRHPAASPWLCRLSSAGDKCPACSIDAENEREGEEAIALG